jgi:hypothetical protein
VLICILARSVFTPYFSNAAVSEKTPHTVYLFVREIKSCDFVQIQLNPPTNSRKYSGKSRDQPCGAWEPRAGKLALARSERRETTFSSIRNLRIG